MRYRFYLFISLFVLAGFSSQAQQMRLALLKYGGGGDWYANPTALKNLAVFCNQNLKTGSAEKDMEVEPGSQQIFNYPFVHVTGHGRLFFTAAEAANIRLYLESGGFIHFDDNYGLDEFIRPEMKKVFPELTFVELPFSHPVFHQAYSFPNGLPKIHEHEGKRSIKIRPRRESRLCRWGPILSSSCSTKMPNLNAGRRPGKQEGTLPVQKPGIIA